MSSRRMPHTHQHARSLGRGTHPNNSLWPASHPGLVFGSRQLSPRRPVLARMAGAGDRSAQSARALLVLPTSASCVRRGETTAGRILPPTPPLLDEDLGRVCRLLDRPRRALCPRLGRCCGVCRRSAPLRKKRSNVQLTCDAMQVGAHTVSRHSWALGPSNPFAKKARCFAGLSREAL
jgi:hypothetical protein